MLGLVAGSAGGATWLVLSVAEWLHPVAWVVVSVVLIDLGVAAQCLAVEAEAVVTPAEAGDLETARARLSRIVGRDTAALGPGEIARACVETVAENTTDGVVAPLLYTALFGPVGLWVFKAVSTLDSMVGYRDDRYRDFGWASARADDAANFVPARLSILLISVAAVFTGDRPGRAWLVGWRDRHRHPSPNSACAEAAVAGALGVRLGGTATYAGVRSVKPSLGEPGREPTFDDVRRSVRLLRRAAWLALGLAAGLCLARG